MKMLKRRSSDDPRPEPLRGPLRAFVLAIAAAVAFRAAPSRAADGGDARSLLRQCLKTQGRTDQISMHVTAEIRLQSADGRAFRQRREYDFRRDGNLLDVAGTSVFLQKPNDRKFQFRTVVNPEYSLNWRQSLNNGQGEKMAIGLPGPADSEEGTPPLFRQYTTDEDFGLAVEGYLPQAGWRRVTEQLLESKDVRIRGEESLGGSPCKIVEGKTPYGDISLWVAPEQGHVVRKTVYTKGPDDLPRAGDRDYLGHEGTRREAWSFVVDGVEVEKVGDAFVPSKGHVRKTHELINQKSSSVDVELTRTKIVLGPPDRDSGLFVMTDLPEGRPISAKQRDGSTITYSWRGGKFTRGEDGPSYPPEPAPGPVPDGDLGYGAARFLARVALTILVCVVLYLRLRPGRRTRTPPEAGSNQG
jgi:hypothetical protein